MGVGEWGSRQKELGLCSFMLLGPLLEVSPDGQASVTW